MICPPSYTDVNECDEFNGQCSHECVNDVPGHHCECPEDMELDVDQKTCIGKILWSVE